MDLTPAQSWLLASLPATADSLLYESRTAANLNLCIGLPRTEDELNRMMGLLHLHGHCDLRDGTWHRTALKPKKDLLF